MKVSVIPIFSHLVTISKNINIFSFNISSTQEKKILPDRGKKKKLSSPLKIKGLIHEFKFPGLEFKFIGMFTTKNFAGRKANSTRISIILLLFNENYRKAFYFNMWKQLASLFLGDKPANMNPSLFSNNQPSALHPHPLVFIF